MIHQNKKIQQAILLKGSENAGKSSTLVLLINKLIDFGFKIIIKNICGGKEYDVSLLMEKDNFSIIIHCASDDRRCVDEFQRFLNYTNNIDLVIVPCRLSGRFSKEIIQICKTDCSKVEDMKLSQKEKFWDDLDNLYEKVIKIYSNSPKATMINYDK